MGTLMQIDFATTTAAWRSNGSGGRGLPLAASTDPSPEPQPPDPLLGPARSPREGGGEAAAATLPGGRPRHQQGMIPR